MGRGILVIAIAVVVLAGCQVFDQLDGPQRLVSDLQGRGLPAVIGTDQDAGLIGGTPTVVCVGDEDVNVYAYPDADAAIDAAAIVNDPASPMVGNANVEWAGRPRFWLRDRAIVLYLGEDQALDAALRDILGRPFAEGADEGRGAVNLPCR